jgi:CheY-like chemotaxis protein
MIKMYSTKLKLEGFQVEFAEDGEAGLEKLQSIKAVGLVILDLMIPKVGGMEVLEKVRSETKFKNLPVIILSNLSQEADIKRATALGVKHFLIKSNYTPSQVVQIVKSYFDGGQPVPEIKPRGDGAMLNSTAEPTVPNSEESEATPPGS